MAERGGFEPPIRFYPYNGLANRRLQPLGHLSCLKNTEESANLVRDPESLLYTVSHKSLNDPERNRSSVKNKFEKVFDNRKQRRRGLSKRNGIFFAQLRLDGKAASATFTALHGAQTVPQAPAAMQEAKAKRDRRELGIKTETY